MTPLPATPGPIDPNAATQSAQRSDPSEIARENFRRYEYVRGRGHSDYCQVARRNEDFYLGGGLQWDPAVREALLAEGRPASEVNEILGAVNAAIGYQIGNRMDVQYVPRGQGADEQTSKALNLITKQILDQVKFRWHETQQFGDGLIEQRGYYDLRVSANEQMQGEICLATLDPMDVIPDPDAKSYDPDDWLDVIVTRWMTADEIGMMYGQEAQNALEAYGRASESDFGDGGSDDGVQRARFGDNTTIADAWDAQMVDGSTRRYRVVDRQHHRYQMAQVAIYPTGDVKQIDDISTEENAALSTQRVVISRRRMKRVRWTVSSCDVLLFDEWSPYKHFTIIPYFPYFRRGRTRGMVDNAISPQETLNKGISQALHIVNSTANSGWTVEQDSLTNMDTDDLEEVGAKTGLVIEHAAGSKPPAKIQPNQVPQGIVQLIETAKQNIKSVTGVNESMLGTGQQDMSGIAIQSRQFAAQQALAMPLDNLARTRNLLATRLIKLIQAYYTDERKFRITQMSAFGEQQSTDVVVNQVQADGSVLNDLTIGDYDVVISEQPMQITFDNSQFEQVKAMRGMNPPVAIPDAIVIRYSNLADKAEVVKAMQDAAPRPDPLTEARVGTETAKQRQLGASAEVAAATAEKLRADTVESSVTGMFSAVRAAAEVAAMPAIAPLADELLRSAGFQDKDAAPIVPNVPAGAQLPAPPAPESTNPLTPPHPDVGVNAGIESPELPA
jgi:hypothetical protein